MVDFASDIDLALINVYPNPFNSTLLISLTNEVEEAEITIQSLNGTTVLSTISTQKTNTLDLSDLNDGVYIVRVVQGNNVRNIKVVKN
jgi:hypothetical protein